MKKIKISELPLYTSLKGLFTIGTDSNNRSVKVSLEFVEEQTTEAVSNANTATAAAKEATTATKTATTEANNATAASKTATANAVEATKQANEATTAAKNATSDAKDATSAAKTATTEANTATTNANTATKNANTAADTANTAADNATKTATAAAKDATDKASAAATEAKKTAEDAAAAATQTADEAAARADEATQKTLETIGRLVPDSMEVEEVGRITYGNLTPRKINAQLYPEQVFQNIIFISDNQAVKVAPDGTLTACAVGTSQVHVIPTNRTALAKTLLIEVGEPTARLSAASTLRLTSTGAFRLN
jgi:uncharacterized phage infection (PIP) family protein YhgE